MRSDNSATASHGHRHGGDGGTGLHMGRHRRTQRGRTRRRWTRRGRGNVAMRRAHPRRMAGRETRRRRHAMDAVRVAIRSVIPVRWSPVWHKAERREGCNGENGFAGRGVPVHGTTVRIAENGEPRGIVTGIRPRYAGAYCTRDGVGGVSRGRVCAGAAYYSHPCHCCYGHRRIGSFHGHIGVD